MRPSAAADFQTADLLELFSKYRWLILFGTLSCSALFYAGGKMLPPKYKSHFVITIYAKYFESPLIRDFIPQVGEGQEMKLQRESLIRQALTPEFLDRLGTQYGIYASTNAVSSYPPMIQKVLVTVKALRQEWGLSKTPILSETSQQAARREELLSHVQIFDLNPMTFNVSFIYSDPKVAYGVAQDIYTQVTQTLPQVRLNNLISIRDAIHKHLQGLGANLTSTPEPSEQQPSNTTNTNNGNTNRPQMVRQELADVRNQIRALSTQYTEDHPVMKELRERERTLSAWSQAITGSEQPQASHPSSSPEGDRATYDDLNKKLSYLNIAIDTDRAEQSDYYATLEMPLYPTASVSPRGILFALYGFAVGLFGSLFIAGVREYFDRAALRTETLAMQLQVPLLGKVPVVRWLSSPHKPAARN